MPTDCNGLGWVEAQSVLFADARSMANSCSSRGIDPSWVDQVEKKQPWPVIDMQVDDQVKLLRPELANSENAVACATSIVACELDNSKLMDYDKTHVNRNLVGDTTTKVMHELDDHITDDHNKTCVNRQLSNDSHDGAYCSDDDIGCGNKFEEVVKYDKNININNNNINNKEKNNIKEYEDVENDKYDDNIDNDNDANKIKLGDHSIEGEGMAMRNTKKTSPGTKGDIIKWFHDMIVNDENNMIVGRYTMGVTSLIENNDAIGRLRNQNFPGSFDTWCASNADFYRIRTDKAIQVGVVETKLLEQYMIDGVSFDAKKVANGLGPTLNITHQIALQIAPLTSLGRFRYDNTSLYAKGWCLMIICELIENYNIFRYRPTWPAGDNNFSLHSFTEANFAAQLTTQISNNEIIIWGPDYNELQIGVMRHLARGGYFVDEIVRGVVPRLSRANWFGIPIRVWYPNAIPDIPNNAPTSDQVHATLINMSDKRSECDVCTLGFIKAATLFCQVNTSDDNVNELNALVQAGSNNTVRSVPSGGVQASSSGTNAGVPPANVGAGAAIPADDIVVVSPANNADANVDNDDVAIDPNMPSGSYLSRRLQTIAGQLGMPDGVSNNVGIVGDILTGVLEANVTAINLATNNVNDNVAQLHERFDRLEVMYGNEAEIERPNVREERHNTGWLNCAAEFCINFVWPRPADCNPIWTWLSVLPNLPGNDPSDSEYCVLASGFPRVLIQTNIGIGACISLGVGLCFNASNIGGLFLNDAVNGQHNNGVIAIGPISQSLFRVKGSETIPMVFCLASAELANVSEIVIPPDAFKQNGWCNNFIDFPAINDRSGWARIFHFRTPYVIDPLSTSFVLKKWPQYWGYFTGHISMNLCNDVILSGPTAGWYAALGSSDYNKAVMNVGTNCGGSRIWHYIPYGLSILNCLSQFHRFNGAIRLRFQRWPQTYSTNQISPALTPSDVYVDNDYDQALCIFRPGVIRTFDWRTNEVISPSIARATIARIWNRIRTFRENNVIGAGLLMETNTGVIDALGPTFDLVDCYDDASSFTSTNVKNNTKDKKDDDKSEN